MCVTMCCIVYTVCVCSPCCCVNSCVFQSDTMSSLSLSVCLCGNMSRQLRLSHVKPRPQLLIIPPRLLPLLSLSSSLCCSLLDVVISLLQNQTASFVLNCQKLQGEIIISTGLILETQHLFQTFYDHNINTSLTALNNKLQLIFLSFQIYPLIPWN